MKVKSGFGSDVRFLSPENWHLTIEFLSYQDDNSINLITKAITDTVQSFEAPIIEFEKIIYGPAGKTPRMIWLVGSAPTSEALSEIKDVLEKNLFEYGVRFRQEARKFNAHVTLARFESAKLDTLPPLEVLFTKSFEAESLDLMESHLKRSGAEYALLSRFDFKEQES